jgi:Zn-dependent peptidase ImmA (M78 family)/transcriptional regulator with XRE-family HTH domain
MTLSERLKYARGRTGLTLKQVVERTGIGESSLSEFENGKRQPRLHQLQCLADAYRRSIAFLLGEGEIPREVVLWRERPDPATSSEIEAEFLKLCQQYHNLEVWCAERRPCALPEASGHPESFEYRDAERLAYQVRSELRLGDRPGRSLITVLDEVCGVKLFHLSFDPTGTAASAVSDTFGAAVLLNAKNVRWRRNFDLGHELFHLMTWNIFRSSDAGDGVQASENEEKFATCFASHLLMPGDVTRLALNEVAKEGAITFSDVFKIARQFDVSVEALLWRIHFLYNRDQEDTRRDIERYRKVGDVWEGRDHDEPPRRPARFEALARQALRQGQISQGRLAEYLGISRKQAMKIAEQEARDDEEIQISPA